MKLTDDKKEIYAKAFEILLSEIQERIEEKATEMYNEGAYVEEDEEDGSHRAYSMSRRDCFADACADFLTDEKNWSFLYFFLDFCVAQIDRYHIMEKSNTYHAAYLPEVSSLAPRGASLHQGNSTLCNE